MQRFKITPLAATADGLGSDGLGSDGPGSDGPGSDVALDARTLVRSRVTLVIDEEIANHLSVHDIDAGIR